MGDYEGVSMDPRMIQVQQSTLSPVTYSSVEYHQDFASLPHSTVQTQVVPNSAQSWRNDEQVATRKFNTYDQRSHQNHYVVQDQASTQIMQSPGTFLDERMYYEQQSTPTPHYVASRTLAHQITSPRYQVQEIVQSPALYQCSCGEVVEVNEPPVFSPQTQEMTGAHYQCSCGEIVDMNQSHQHERFIGTNIGSAQIADYNASQSIQSPRGILPDGSVAYAGSIQQKSMSVANSVQSPREPLTNGIGTQGYATTSSQAQKGATNSTNQGGFQQTEQDVQLLASGAATGDFQQTKQDTNLLASGAPPPSEQAAPGDEDKPFKKPNVIANEALKGEVTSKGELPEVIPEIGVTEKFEGIRLDWKQRGVLYEDPNFPATDKSLYYQPQSSTQDIVWMRPGEITAQVGTKPAFVVDDYDLIDMQQGYLGDCWFIAGIGCLVSDAFTKKNLLPRVVPPYQSFHPQWYAGMFCFHFWVFDQWKTIIIDDRLPTVHKQPLYLHSTQKNEFWGPLLEKAYAKLNGSYEALAGGTCAESMVAMTAGMAETYKIKHKGKFATDPTAEFLSNLVEKSFNTRSIAGGAIYRKPPGQVVDEAATGQILENGLVGGHAYTLITEQDVKPTGSRKKTCLFKVRNPWGTDVEWKGAWSDNSELWQTIPPLMQQKTRMVADDGEFWMDVEDYMANFDETQIGHIPPYLNPVPGKKFHVTQFKGMWKRGISAGGRPKFRETFWQNPQFVMKLTVADDDIKDGLCTILVGLAQRDTRPDRAKGKKLISIGYVIYKIDDNQKVPAPREFFDENNFAAAVKTFINSTETVYRFRLAPGRYMIVPCTFDAGIEAEFLLRIFSLAENNAAGRPSGRIELTKDPIAKLTRTAERQSDIDDLYREVARGSQRGLTPFDLLKAMNLAIAQDPQLGMIKKETAKTMTILLAHPGRYVLSKEEFYTALDTFYKWRHQFQAGDSDKNGTVTKSDLKEALAHQGIILPDELIQKFVYRFAHESGELTFNDFIVVLARCTRMIQFFEKRNKTGGVLSLGKEEVFSILIL